MFTPDPALGRRDSRSLSRFLSRQRARPSPAPGRALFWAISGRHRPGKTEPAAIIGAWRTHHAHGLSGESDAGRLGGAFALIVAFMVAELVAGILGSSSP